MNDEKQLLEHREKEYDDDGHESDEFSEGGSDSEG